MVTMELEQKIFDVGEESYFENEREYFLAHDDFEVSQIYDSAKQPILYFIAESYYSKVVVTLIK